MDGMEARAIGSACLVLHVRRAARRMGRLYDEALRPVALNNGQFSLLTMLAAREDWTMQELADALGLDQSSLTAAVKPLGRRGLVDGSADGADRRIRRLVLSDAGRALVDAAAPLWRRAQGEAEALLGARSTADFRAELRALG